MIARHDRRDYFLPALAAADAWAWGGNPVMTSSTCDLKSVCFTLFTSRLHREIHMLQEYHQ